MVELIVENQSLDLYEGEVMSLTMAINDMASIESREGNYSNKFSIPSTTKNNAILGYPNELNFVTGFKPTKSRNARIAIDGLDVQRGFIQVEQYNQNKKEFSVSFFSGNTDWLDDLGDKQLGDLNLSKYNHIWNSANVSASFTNTEGYIYPFINYGRYDLIINNDTELINWLPAMYTHTLIKQMFADIDWKVEGNLFQDPIFLKHILPFSIKQLSYSKEELDLVGFVSNGASGTYAPAIPIVYPNVIDGNSLGSYDDSTGVYTSNFSGVVNVYAEFDFVRTTNDKIEVRKNGVVEFSAKAANTVGNVSIIPTDTITVTLSNGGIYAGGTGAFIVRATSDLLEGMTMSMSSTLPDLSQESLLQTVFNQFGAVFTSDNISKTVYINKFEVVKDNIVNAIDWTDKIDVSREIEIDYTELVSGYAKVNTLGYKENEDSEIGGFASGVKPFLGNGSFTIDNDFLSKSDELFESDFVASDVLDCFNDRIKLMYVPRYTNSAIGINSPDIDPNPRCAIVVTNVSVTDLFAEDETSIDILGDINTNVTTLPFCYFNTPLTGIDEIDSINQGLAFGDNVSPKGQKNLIETYYPDFISILNNPRRITAYFLLNERDINNLDFLVPRYLGGELNNYFYINSVKDYRPTTSGVTKVELVLIA